VRAWKIYAAWVFGWFAGAGRWWELDWPMWAISAAGTAVGLLFLQYVDFSVKWKGPR
jgi:hypothetical protein